MNPLRTAQGRTAREVVGRLGGRYSTELGIDVDDGDAEVERWFLAATLFGTRISASIAERTFLKLNEVGLTSIDRARHVPPEDLVRLLDAGGYARYDFRTADRLRLLSELVDERYDGQVCLIGRQYRAYPALRTALLALPGWGPVTAGLFLRELRGVWPGACPPLAPRAEWAARHLGLPGPGLGPLTRLAAATGVDARDLESGLVRLALAHRRVRGPCAGGSQCTVLFRSPDPVPFR